MARMKFLCDAERCIECNGCVTACKQEHDIPWGVNRRRVVTINDGVPGERSISVACMHCSDAPCMAVCPVDCFYRTDDGVVLHDKDLCIGCGYCFYACPFGAPQFPQAGAFGVRGKMDKCTFCAGGPEPNNSEAEYKKYGRNRLAEGKLPVCAEMCSTKALLGGEGDVLADIYRERVTTRGKGSEVWGWATAYGRPEAPKGAPVRQGRQVHPPRLGHRLEVPNRDQTRISVSSARCSRSDSPVAASARRSSTTSRVNTRASPTRRRTTRRPGTATSAIGSSPSPTATRVRTNTSGSASRREGGRVSRSIIGIAGTLTFALMFAAGLAAAQSPAVNPKEAADARAQQQQQVAQPLNNQPVWSEVRSGAPQSTTVRGRETNVLIQPEGQTWRAVRVPVLFWGGIIFALAVCGLAVFYMLRGTMGEPGKPGERVIERFSPMDRYAHWFVAIVWVALAITGLILSLGKAVLLPLIGYTLFSWLATLAKSVHNFAGPLLIIGVPWLFVRFLRDNGLKGEDFRWFANIIGYFKGHEYPSDRFNAGEKLVFWLVADRGLDDTDRQRIDPALPELRSDALDDASRQYRACGRRVPFDRPGVRAHLSRDDRSPGRLSRDARRLRQRILGRASPSALVPADRRGQGAPEIRRAGNERSRARGSTHAACMTRPGRGEGR